MRPQLGRPSALEASRTLYAVPHTGGTDFRHGGHVQQHMLGDMVSHAGQIPYDQRKRVSAFVNCNSNTPPPTIVSRLLFYAV